MNRPVEKIMRLLLPTLTGILLIAAWYGIKAYWDIHDFILPAPHQILIAFASEGHQLSRGALVTIAGATIGFLAAGLLGFTLSLAMVSLRYLRYGLYPFVVFMQMIPVIATAAIVVIFFGTGIRSVAMIAFLIGFFPVVANTLQGLLSVPAGQRELFRLYKAGPWQELLLLRVPNSLPWFFTGLKIAATLAVIGSVTGEIFAGSSSRAGGLGFLILVYKSELKIDALYAATLLCCLLGFLFVSAVLTFRHFFLSKWHESVLPEQE